jgi:hypothetical protein
MITLVSKLLHGMVEAIKRNKQIGRRLTIGHFHIGIGTRRLADNQISQDALSKTFSKAVKRKRN